MPRARSQNQDDWQTAVASETGSGCLSFYMLPPLAALVIAGFVAFLAFKSPLTPSALPMAQHNSTMLLQTAAPPMNNSVSPTQIPGLSLNSPDAAVTPIWSFASDNMPAPGALSPIFTKEVQHWGNDIVRWANAAALDPNLAATIMQIESCGDPRATSRSGAMGLFQVMPFHFRFGDNPYNPETNATRGLSYLIRSLGEASGNPRLALAGYNGGVGVIARSEWLWPSETKRYVYYGAPIYEDARSGATSSAMLTEWYEKYGVSLCRQAAQRLGIP
ncbi:MAG TPA: transglycosylase SLT domain-containing protein [Anaerolineales bacterium]|nr:transglycosylase SLT domain-containing protein [Anaerolineales bacterium]